MYILISCTKGIYFGPNLTTKTCRERWNSTLKLFLHYNENKKMWRTGINFREPWTADENSVKPRTCSNRTSAYRSFVFYTRAVGARRARACECDNPVCGARSRRPTIVVCSTLAEFAGRVVLARILARQPKLPADKQNNDQCTTLRATRVQ